MKKLEGKLIADTILVDVKKRVARLSHAPRLVVVQVGEHAASTAYIQRKSSAARTVGIDVDVRHYPEDISTKALRKEISTLARQSSITGIIVQLPLPKTVRTQYILDGIPLSKDVDGLSSKNMGKLATGRKAIIPPTAAGIIKLLEKAAVTLEGSHVVMVGSGRLVGRPTGLIFLAKGATVTFIDKHTKDMPSLTRMADIVIAGAGEPHLITEEWIKKDATVIDAGFTIVNDVIVGDVNYNDIALKAAALTPVPGGVGPLTVAMLLSNIADAAEQKK